MELGRERFEQLSDEEKGYATLFIWAGCGMHARVYWVLDLLIYFMDAAFHACFGTRHCQALGNGG